VFQVSSDSLFTPAALETTWTVADSGEDTICTQTPVELMDNTQYFWRVNAYDGADSSGWSDVWTFNTLLDNEPPTMPAHLSPDSGTVFDTYQVTLCINNASDPDTSPLSLRYVFQLATIETFAEASLEAVWIVGEADADSTCTLVPDMLDNNTLYFWRVNAFDGADSSGWTSPWSFDVQVPNERPDIPVLSYPASGAVVDTTETLLCLENADDPDAGPEELDYVFQLTRGGSFSADSLVATWSVDESSGDTTCTSTPGTLSDSTWYSWRANAYDGADSSGWTAGRSFHVLMPNLPPEIPEATGSGNELVTGSTITLSITPVVDPEGGALTYCFELYADSLLTTLLADTCGIVEVEGSVQWVIEIEEELANLIVPRHAYYFWRARSYDGANYSPYSPTASFYVSSVGSSQPFVFPNPFLPEHSTVTFSNVPPLSTVRVWSQDGREIIELGTDAVAWSIQWDGMDSDGNPAPAGIYVYSVSGTKNFTGKLAIVR
jgi:hypothetical protein